MYETICEQHETLKRGLKRSEEEKENLMTRYRCKNVISNLQDCVAHLTAVFVKHLRYLAS